MREQMLDHGLDQPLLSTEMGYFQVTFADGAVIARIPEAYQWLIVPVQNSPQTALEWQAFRLSGSGALAVRAGKKLRNDELLVLALAGGFHNTFSYYRFG